jgi:uncharacterized protein (TIGR02147 family)
MTIFEFRKYKDFVNKRIEEMPKGGRGQYRKMANFLSVNSVNVSQVFKGNRHLTPEQACELIEFFGLSELEGQYFLALVELDKAGTPKLKKHIEKNLESLIEKSSDLKHRLKQDTQLTEETKAVFYSNWYYSGVRLLSSIKDFNSPDAIAAYFNLPLTTVNRVLEFLLQTGLCKMDGDQIKMGPRSTHLEASSPLVTRHHMNWRVKGMEKMGNVSPEELFLSLPASLSEKAIKDIRKELVASIERVTGIIDSSTEDSLACLNIDFFKF